MNINDTQTQLLTYIASMVLRINSQQRHLQARLQLLEMGDGPEIEVAKKCYGIESSNRLTQLELESFGEQFPELLVFAREYSELSDERYREGVVEAFAKASMPTPPKNGSEAE